MNPGVDLYSLTDLNVAIADPSLFVLFFYFWLRIASKVRWSGRCWAEPGRQKPGDTDRLPLLDSLGFSRMLSSRIPARWGTLILVVDMIYDVNSPPPPTFFRSFLSQKGGTSSDKRYCFVSPPRFFTLRLVVSEFVFVIWSAWPGNCLERWNTQWNSWLTVESVDLLLLRQSIVWLLVYIYIYLKGHSSAVFCLILAII